MWSVYAKDDYEIIGEQGTGIPIYEVLMDPGPLLQCPA